MKVIVIGTGIAGLTASIKASDCGADVDLISPSYSEHAQSAMAAGGINAAINSFDSVENHFKDTMNGGIWINDEKAVLKLTQNAASIIKWLSEIGTNFTRKNQKYDTRYFGGQKIKRTLYAGVRTGKQIITALDTLCRKKEVEGTVKRYVGWRLLSLLLNENNRCFGVICIHEDSGKIKSFTSDAVIIATGGLNGLFKKTSGSIQNDGCATARLFLQGVKLSNLEMIQFHPTTIETYEKKLLISEAARGEGGRLFVMKNNKRYYFMKELYPELAELMPRDIVSRSIYKVSQAGKNQVYLDISHLDEKTVKIKLDEIYKISMKYLNIDPTKKPIPVYPGIHYFMGGIKTDENHRTNIKALFACGECSSQYHGANRLGGNSLLGAVHGGFCAGINAVKVNEYQNNHSAQKQLEKEKEKYAKWDSNILNEDDNEISKILNDSLGIYRCENELTKAINRLDNLKQVKKCNDYYEYIKIKSTLTLAKAIILSALHRKESRGAHQRTDYPHTDEKYKKSTDAIYKGEIRIC